MAHDMSVQVRLEGAMERLQRALPRLRRAHGLLRQSRWLTALRRHPRVLEVAAQDELALDADLQRARTLTSESAELSKLVTATERARVELWVVMTEKLGEKPSSLLDGVHRLLLLVRNALPGPPRPGERTVAVIAAERPNEAALGVATVFGAPYSVALFMENPDTMPFVIGGASLALAGFVGRAVTTALIGGTCTVTCERLVWRPRRAEARQVALADIAIESVRTVTPRTVELRAPDLLRMRLLESPSWAATAIALQARFGHDSSLNERVCVPCTAAVGGRSARHTRGSAIVWSRGAAFVPAKSGKPFAAALLGHTPRFTVDLDALCGAVSHLPDERFAQALTALTEQGGAVLDPQTVQVQKSGPDEVLFSSTGARLWAKLTPHNEAQLRHAVEIFERRTA